MIGRKHIFRRIMACILCAVMLVTLLPGDIWYNSSAQAGGLNKFVTSVHVYDKNNTKIDGEIVLGGNDNFTIEYNFKIPNSEQTYSAGSTIDTYIPTEYCEFANPDKAYDLKDSAGAVIATFTVDTSGYVVIEFTDKVEGKSNVEGFFYVGCNLNAENVANNEKIEIDLEIPNIPPITITVNNEEPGKSNPYISKSADYSRDFGWQIVVNPGGSTSTEGMKIKDTLVNQVIDGDVKFGDKVLHEGTDYTYNDKTGEFVFNIKENITSAKTLYIPTKLTNEALANEGENKEYTNTATLVNEDGTEDIDKATGNRWYTTDWIKKSGNYNTSSKTITWTIEVNNNGQTVDDASIVDDFTKGGEYEIVSAKLNGEAIDITGNTVKLGDITTKQTLVVEVKKTDDSSISGTVKNEAVFKGNGVPSSAKDEGTIYRQMNYIDKSGAYNDSTGKIDWTVIINPDEEEISNVKFADVLPEGLALDEATFKVDGNSVNASYKESSREISYSFGDGAITTRKTITFTTSIESSAIQNNVQKTFNNTASLTGDGVPDNTTDNTTVSFTPSYFEKTCNQWYSQNDDHGDYTGDAYNKATHEITWKYRINKSCLHMTAPVITDTIPSTQTFVTDSVQVYNHSTGAAVKVDASEYSVTQNADANTFTITFNNDIDDFYTVTYKTKIDDEDMPSTGSNTYTNSATINTDGNTTTDDATSPSVSGYSLDKSGTILQNTTDTSNAILAWQVDINKNQVEIPAGVITDTLTKGQALVEGSVKLQVLNCDAYGNWSVGATVDKANYSYTYNELSRTFTFNMPENSSLAYRLTFNSEVVDRTIKSVSNVANFKGTSPSKSNESTITGIDANLVGGGIVIGDGQLKVIKVDENDQTKTLPGAVFTLHKVVLSGSETLATNNTANDITLGDLDATDENGLTGYDAIMLDTDYYITEKIAPEGYNLSTYKYYFNISSADEDKTIIYYYEDSKISKNGSIAITKYNDGTPASVLAGATFTLYKDEVEVDTAITGSNGVAYFNNVPYGEYVVKETSAPKGYILSDPAYNKAVTVDATHKTVTLEAINAAENGSIAIKKTDDAAAKNPLAGAEFTLYDQYQNVITTSTTDSGGNASFSGLAYGKYYIKETKAPVGYEISDTSMKEVNITDNTELAYNYEDAAIVGKVKVKKTDADTGAPLATATFGIYTIGGNLIKTAMSGSDGYALFEDIPYGNYIVREVTAPSGYIKTSVQWSVSVAETTTYTNDNLFINTEENATIKLKKSDKEGVYLAGAEFTLYDSSGNAVATAASGNGTNGTTLGEVVFTDIKYGSYTIKETKAPTGYYINSTVIPVNVKANTTYTLADVEDTLIPTNPPFIALKAKKVDSVDNNKGIPGATLGVYKQAPGATDKTLITSVVTNAEGIAYFEKINVEEDETGTVYYLGEVAPATGYKLTSTTIVIGELYALTTDTGANPNIAYYTYNDENHINYTFDTAVLLGDKLTNEAISGRINITKVDSNDATHKLSGAEFTIYSDAACLNPVTTLGTSGVATTNGEGVASYENVPCNTYYIKETKAPAGYTLGTRVQKVVVTKDYVSTDATSAYSYTFTDVKIKAGITITKRDADNGKLLSGAVFKLCDVAGNLTNPEVSATTNSSGVATFSNLSSNVTYYFKETKAPEGYVLDSTTIYSVAASEFTAANNYKVSKNVTNEEIYGSLTVKKQDGDSSPLAGAEITLYRTSDNKALQSKLSAVDGTVAFDNIPYGDYYVRETKAPLGYVIDNSVAYITVNDFGTDGTVKKVLDKAFTNTKMSGQIKIVKRDSADAKPLSGAVFALYKEAAPTVEINRITTGNDGMAIFNVDSYEKYIVKEISAPKGYAIDSTEGFEFNITSGNNTQSMIVTDTKKSGTIEIVKQNRAGNLLKGATFTLYKEDKINPVITVTNPVTTGSDGKVVFAGLEYGTYYLKETTAPYGYVLDDTMREVVIDGSELDNVYTINWINVENPKVPTGSITLIKYDAVDKTIKVPGATYTLYKGGLEYASGITDENGSITFSNLPYGDDYMIKETKAPLGYALSAEVIYITVDDTTLVNGNIPISVLEPRATGSITINKYNDDLDNPIVLSGATFDICDLSGNVVATITTDDNGKAMIDNLPIAKYTIKETKAPIGYKLSTLTWQVEVAATALNPVITINNTKDDSILGNISMYKVDSESDTTYLKGATFGLMQGDAVVMEATSGDDGLIKFDNVPIGTYTLKETKAPEGYDLSSEVREVKVDEARVYHLDNFKNDKTSSTTTTTTTITSKKTADNSPIAIPIAILLGSIVIASTLIYRRKITI